MTDLPSEVEEMTKGLKERVTRFAELGQPQRYFYSSIDAEQDCVCASLLEAQARKIAEQNILLESKPILLCNCPEGVCHYPGSSVCRIATPERLHLLSSRIAEMEKADHLAAEIIDNYVGWAHQGKCRYNPFKDNLECTCGLNEKLAELSRLNLEQGR